MMSKWGIKQFDVKINHPLKYAKSVLCVELYGNCDVLLDTQTYWSHDEDYTSLQSMYFLGYMSPTWNNFASNIPPIWLCMHNSPKHGHLSDVFKIYSPLIVNEHCYLKQCHCSSLLLLPPLLQLKSQQVQVVHLWAAQEVSWSIANIVSMLCAKFARVTLDSKNILAVWLIGRWERQCFWFHSCNW